MITYFQAIILGVLQGITELFPVSSLGHSVLVPALFHWNIDQSANYFLVFLVATHLATSLVLLIFFYKDWVLIVKGLFRSLKNRAINSSDHYAQLGWLLVVASIPAGILGVLFEDKLKLLFAAPTFVAIFLILNGFLLYGAEMLRKKKQEKAETSPHNSQSPDVEISKMSWSKAIGIGFAQCLALLPGFSRTGATLGGGLVSGLDHEQAARFAFLLATPIILAAAVLKLPDLAVSSSGSGMGNLIGPICAGFIASAIGAYFSVRFLSSYFKTKKLTPFAWYCVIVGIVSLLVLR